MDMALTFRQTFVLTLMRSLTREFSQVSHSRPQMALHDAALQRSETAVH